MVCVTTNESAASAVWIAHGLVMNGGVLHCVESLSEKELRTAIAGYRLFDLSQAADILVEATRVSADEADAAEGKLDTAYSAAIHDDEFLASHINAAFPSEPLAESEPVGEAAVASAIETFIQASPDEVRLSSVPGKTREQHRAAGRTESALKELLKYWDSGGHDALLRLLDHPDNAVRVSAASYLVVADSDRAIPILKDLEQVTGPVGSSAHMMLLVMEMERFVDPLAHLRKAL